MVNVSTEHIRGIHLTMKPEKNGRLTPTLRVGWVDEGRTPRRTTISVTKHGIKEAVKLALEKRGLDPLQRDASLYRKAAAFFNERLNTLQG